MAQDYNLVHPHVMQHPQDSRHDCSLPPLSVPIQLLRNNIGSAIRSNLYAKSLIRISIHNYAIEKNHNNAEEIRKREVFTIRSPPLRLYPTQAHAPSRCRGSRRRHGGAPWPWLPCVDSPSRLEWICGKYMGMVEPW
jgi:hypothetical protein